MKEKTAEEMFGEPIPGEAVKHKDVDPLRGYRQRPKFRRRLDGRLYPVDVKREVPETELPDDYCPD